MSKATDKILYLRHNARRCVISSRTETHIKTTSTAFRSISSNDLRVTSLFNVMSFPNIVHVIVDAKKHFIYRNEKINGDS